MGLIEVLLFVFGLASLSGVLRHREEIQRVEWYRVERQKECDDWKRRYPDDYKKRTNFCDERYGYPRQWWEPKTYQELLDEQEKNNEK